MGLLLQNDVDVKLLHLYYLMAPKSIEIGEELVVPWQTIGKVLEDFCACLRIPIPKNPGGATQSQFIDWVNSHSELRELLGRTLVCTSIRIVCEQVEHAFVESLNTDLAPALPMRPTAFEQRYNALAAFWLDVLDATLEFYGYRKGTGGAFSASDVTKTGPSLSEGKSSSSATSHPTSPDSKTSKFHSDAFYFTRAAQGSIAQSSVRLKDLSVFAASVAPRGNGPISPTSPSTSTSPPTTSGSTTSPTSPSTTSSSTTVREESSWTQALQPITELASPAQRLRTHAEGARANLTSRDWKPFKVLLADERIGMPGDEMSQFRYAVFFLYRAKATELNDELLRLCANSMEAAADLTPIESAMEILSLYGFDARQIARLQRLFVTHTKADIDSLAQQLVESNNERDALKGLVAEYEAKLSEKKKLEQEAIALESALGGAQICDAYIRGEEEADRAAQQVLSLAQKELEVRSRQQRRQASVRVESSISDKCCTIA